MEKFSITIATPCQQPWEQMEARGKGKFCSSCQKVVIDFSNSSDNEIAEYLVNHPGICGRFHNQQLQKTYSYTAHTTAFIKKKWFYFLGFLYAELMAPYAKAQNKPLLKPDTYLAETINKDSGHLLNGIITNNAGEAMPYVNIRIKGTGKFAVTGLDGKFSIQASDHDVLVVSSMAYKTREIIVGSRSLIDITLREDIKVLDEVLATGYGVMGKTDMTAGMAQIMFVAKDDPSDSTHTVKSTIVRKKRSFFKWLFGIK